MKQKLPARETIYHEIFTKAFGGEPHPPFDLSAHQLNRALHKTYNVMVTAHDEFMRPYNLSMAKYRLLVWLLACEKAGYDDGRLPSALSHFQGVTPNTISALLSGLQKEGWIVRAKHSTDARKTVLSITQAGRDLVEQTRDQFDGFIRNLMQDMSEEERVILTTLLNKLSKSMLENGGCEPHDLKPEKVEG